MTVVAVRVSTQNRHSTFILMYVFYFTNTEMLYECKLKSISTSKCEGDTDDRYSNRDENKENITTPKLRFNKRLLFDF